MEIKRIVVATLLSALILIGFDYFMPKPQENQTSVQGKEAARTESVLNPATQTPPVQPASSQAAARAAARRIAITGPDVLGSIDTRGALLDDLVLTKYRETLAADSPLVRLLDRPGGAHPNYVVIGWENAAGSDAKLPDSGTVWESDAESLTPDHPVTLRWDNGEGQVFTIRFAIDRHYVFSVVQSVENHGTKAVSLVPFQRVQRDYEPPEGAWTAHEGPVAVMNGRLTDASYKNLRGGAAHPDHTSWAATGTGGWDGFSDKYWLTAILADAGTPVTAGFAYVPGERGSYRVGMAGQSPEVIAPGGSASQASHVFAGAKVVEALQSASRDLHVPDLDKAIDFGWFGFLTRPILYLLHWLYVHLGNFGLALMALTLIVKIVLFPLASKSAVSSARMRMLAPKIKEINERYKDQPLEKNQRVMALYREEGVNPMSGCLPVLIQAPIFFCLYKMLNISIDERHAPFFGWIKDLSVPDPTNLFNLFGLLPFDPTVWSAFLHVSLWGTALGVTFWLLQRQTMVSMDPAQAKMMQFMPLFYVFFMSGFPAGLLVYYTWNNLLTVAQQAFIQRGTKLPVPVSTASR